MLPRHLPDFTDKRVIDRHLDRLDNRGVSRRDFLALASAGVAASAAAVAMGLPSMAVAAPNGKIAYLAWSASTEYNQLVGRAAAAAAAELGINYTLLDGRIDAGRQLNQFEELTTTLATGGFFNILDGSALRRVSQLADASKVYFGAVWDSLPWFTPFEASDYYTLYAVPEEFTAHRSVTTELLRAVTERFGGGKVIGITGVPGFSTDSVRSRGRDAAFKDFPKTTLVDQLPGMFNREDSLKAAQALLARHPDVVGVVAQNDDVAQGVLGALRAAGLKPGRDVLVVGADGTAEGARAVKSDQQLATTANIPAFQAGLVSVHGSGGISLSEPARGALA